MSVLMSESFINSFNRFIQMADSFRNKSIGCQYEWATESIDSLTHSLRLCKPHLARHKYIINCRLHWMPLKLESFSCENDVLTRDCDIYRECARDCDVSACDACNKRICSESARRETDRSVMREIGQFWSLASQSCISINLLELEAQFPPLIQAITLFFNKNHWFYWAQLSVMVLAATACLRTSAWII